VSHGARVRATTIVMCAALWGAAVLASASNRVPMWIGRAGLAVAVTGTVVAVLRPRAGAVRPVVMLEHSDPLAARVAATEAKGAEHDARLDAVFETMRLAAEATGIPVIDEPRLRLVGGRHARR